MCMSVLDNSLIHCRCMCMNEYKTRIHYSSLFVYHYGVIYFRWFLVHVFHNLFFIILTPGRYLISFNLMKKLLILMKYFIHRFVSVHVQYKYKCYNKQYTSFHTHTIFTCTRMNVYTR